MALRTLFLLAYTAMSVEVILTFSEYAIRKDLLDRVTQHVDVLSVMHSVNDLISRTDFLVLYVSNRDLELFSEVQGVKGWHIHQKLSRKPLSYLNSKNKNKPFDLLQIDDMWNQGYKGQGVKVAIFDSGVSAEIPVEMCRDFTNDKNCKDYSGHGTFISSIFVSKDLACPGIVPDAEVYMFKVFNAEQESMTAWFLEAFNYAMHLGIDIINLSTGGIDFTDIPFTEKVKELVDYGIVVVSAIGNDGPGHGTLSNPGDQPETIGVGGLDSVNEEVAAYSSAGPSLWENSGRIKPDILTYSSNIFGFSKGSCRTSSGTSIASPILTASLTLIMSSLQRKVPPSLVKQALIISSDLLPETSVFEQGAGIFNITSALNIMQGFNEHISVWPAMVNLTDPRFSPFNYQPLIPDSVPLVLNITVLSSEVNQGSFQLQNLQTDYSGLRVTFETTGELQAGTGHVGVYLSVDEHVGDEFQLTADVVGLSTTSQIKIAGHVSSPVPRNKKILFDSYHSLKYPESGYIASDEKSSTYPFDWRGDSIYTNYLDFFEEVVSAGYHIDILHHSFSCVDSSRYGIYILADPEAQYSKQEITKLRYDLEENEVSLWILAEWYDERFNDDVYNHKMNKMVSPDSNGSDLRTLNDLLSPYFIEFSPKSYSGSPKIAGIQTDYKQGTVISRFPAGGNLITRRLSQDYASATDQVGILGIAQVLQSRIAVFGDTSCLDRLNTSFDWLFLVKPILAYLSNGYIDKTVFPYESLLPHDYDNHLEVIYHMSALQPIPLDPDRLLHLQCIEVETREYETYSFFQHDASAIKLQTWSDDSSETNWASYIQVVLLITALFVLYWFVTSNRHKKRRI